MKEPVARPDCGEMGVDFNLLGQGPRQGDVLDEHHPVLPGYLLDALRRNVNDTFVTTHTLPVVFSSIIWNY